MAIDRFATTNGDPGKPAEVFFPIVPNDGADIEFVTTGLYVGGGGDVAAVDRSTGTAVVFKSVPSGTILPIRTHRVRSTGTTATNLVGLA